MARHNRRQWARRAERGRHLRTRRPDRAGRRGPADPRRCTHWRRRRRSSRIRSARTRGDAAPSQTCLTYANPLPGHPAAIAHRDLGRTCAELDDDGSLGRLLRPLAESSDAVVDFMLGDKRSLPARHPGVAVTGRRGCPGVVHRRCRPYGFTDGSLVSAGAGLMAAGWVSRAPNRPPVS